MTATPEPTTYGQVCYKAYAEKAEGKAFNGEPLKQWEEFSDKIRFQWEEAAQAVITEWECDL